MVRMALPWAMSTDTRPIRRVTSAGPVGCFSSAVSGPARWHPASARPPRPESRCRRVRSECICWRQYTNRSDGLGVDGDIGVGGELVNGGFDVFGEVVGLGQRLTAVDQNVEINEEHRPGIAHANLMAVLHTGDGLDGLGDALLEAFRGAIEKRVDGAAAQLDADPNDDDGHPEGGDSVALAQKAERREDLAGFDGDQAEDHHRRAPDI